MTTTSTTELEGLLSARKAELTGPPAQPEIIDAEVVDMTTGEIVPAAAVEQSPIAPAAPAPDPMPSYPTIPPKVVGGLPYIHEYVKLARTICMTEMVPVSMRGAYDKITACFMRGYELGMGPMQALDSFDIIQGKAAIKPEAMRALIMDAGHLFILSEGQDDNGLYAEVTCRRKDWPERIPDAIYRYGWSDAIKAGLVGKDNWKKQPRAMLQARATGGAGRAHFADVIAGFSYTTGEVMDFAPEQEVPPSPPPAAPALADSSATGSAPLPDASSTDSAPATSPEDPPPAPPTASTSDAGSSKPESAPAKKARGSRKAAAASTLTEALQPSSPPASPSETPSTEPTGPTQELPSHGSPGEAAVLVQMGLALTELINSLPNAQPALCRAFLQQHFPGRKTADLSESELTLATTIAAGWPQSADQHPIPDNGQQEMGF